MATVGHLDGALALAREHQPDVALLDMRAPDSRDWARALARQSPEVKLVGLGLSETEDNVLVYAGAGFAGYVPREAPLEDLVAVVQGIVRAHGGAISATSVVGKGTKMRVLLPATDEPVADKMPIDAPPVRGTGRILLVDDEPMIAAVGKRMLEGLGYQVTLAFSGSEALSRLTLDPYRTVFTYPNLARSVWNSLLLALGSATIIMLVTSVICWIVVKTRLPGRWLLDNIASLPMVFPGLVLGLSIMILYLYLPIGVYGTIWIMLIAYVTRFMPYGLRYNTASMLQIHKELEESAAMSGASWWSSFTRVVLPLLKPGLVAGWIYIAIVSLRELSSSILLYSPGTEVMSIMIWELWENGQYVELSALGVMLIVLLFVMVQLAQLAGSRFGVKDA